MRINVRAEGRYGFDEGGNQSFGGTVTAASRQLLRFRLEQNEIIAEGSGDGLLWEQIGSVPRSRYPGDPTLVRVGKMAGANGVGDYQDLGPAGSSKLSGLKVWGVAK